MKKMIIVACAIAVATVANASSLKWGSAMTGGVMYKAGSTTEKMTSGTAYLFDANTYAVAALLDDFVGDGVNMGNALDSNTFTTAGKLSNKELATTDSQKYNLYVAVINGDQVFVNAPKEFTAPSGEKSTAASLTLSASQNAVVEWTAGTTTASAGWYKAASTPGPTPEPTSGLLLVLGMAGLALRRRHA